MSDIFKRVKKKSENLSLHLNPDKSEKIPLIIREQVIKILFRYLNPETTTVFLFGSLAENTDMKYSDIDIGIISGDEISDAVFLSLCEELDDETDTLKKNNLVDFGKVDNTFRKFALENIEIWHTAENLK